MNCAATMASAILDCFANFQLSIFVLPVEDKINHVALAPANVLKDSCAIKQTLALNVELKMNLVVILQMVAQDAQMV